jgi:hypothetical protein
LGRLGSDAAALSSNASLRSHTRKCIRLIQHTAHSANIPTDGQSSRAAQDAPKTVHPPFLSTISQMQRPSAAFGARIASFIVVGRWHQ